MMMESVDGRRTILQFDSLVWLGDRDRSFEFMPLDQHEELESEILLPELVVIGEGALSPSSRASVVFLGVALVVSQCTA